VLSWIKRLEIAIDSARGVWFLHTYQGGCIVHRDIKVNFIIILNIFSTMFRIVIKLAELYNDTVILLKR